MKLYNNMKWYTKRILYTICVIFLCIGDQRLSSASGEQQLLFTNVAPFIIGLFILAHYPLRSYLRLSCCIWGGICLIAMPPAIFWGYRHSSYANNFAFLVCIIALYGLLLIRTFIALFAEKRVPNTPPALLALFGLFLLFSSISRYDNPLTVLYFSAFFLFLLTAFDKKEISDFLSALIDGIIISFFLIQGLAFVFRPYDTIRYMGLYANTNMNALFYQFVYCAFLCRFCLLEANHLCYKNKKAIAVWKWLCFFFGCSMWNFVLFTMCRSAMMGMSLVTVFVVIWLLCKKNGRKPLLFLKYTGMIILTAAVSFPIAYSAVRYIPAFFHHPIFFYNDYSEERIHSWEAWDSPKYIDWRDVLSENFGRLQDLLSIASKEEALSSSPILLASSDADYTPEAIADFMSAQRKEFKSTTARIDIYTYYLKLLNFTGHREDENGIQLTATYFAPHAHNLFLQYAFNYGIPAGVFFLLYIVLAGFLLMKQAYKTNEDTLFLIPLLLFAAAATFGMTEMMWRFGMLSHTLLLLLPFCTVRGRRRAIRDAASGIPTA